MILGGSAIGGAPKFNFVVHLSFPFTGDPDVELVTALGDPIQIMDGEKKIIAVVKIAGIYSSAEYNESSNNSQQSVSDGERLPDSSEVPSS